MWIAVLLRSVLTHIGPEAHPVTPTTRLYGCRWWDQFEADSLLPHFKITIPSSICAAAARQMNIQIAGGTIENCGGGHRKRAAPSPPPESRVGSLNPAQLLN